MTARAFSFRSRWAVPAPPGRVWATLVDLGGIGAWWPDFQRVRLVDGGRPGGVGRAVDATLRGPLGVRFRVRLRIEEAVPGRSTGRATTP